jgi:hypothetical protein
MRILIAEIIVWLATGLLCWGLITQRI